MAADWVMKFRLPGGTKLAATIDMARTVCRRLERLIVAYSKDHQVRPMVLKTINRYSDYLFVLRCFVNHQMGYEEHIFQRDRESEYLEKVKAAID
jgi:cob(I)alamin adenosyltransferase